MPRPIPIIRARRIAGRVAQLGRAISRDHAGQPLQLVVLLDGAACFAVDLMRHLALPGLRVHFARARSYGDRTRPRGRVELADLPTELPGPVLVVDDILDTGGTLTAVGAALAERTAMSVQHCVLLDKPSRRRHPVAAHYTGFTIPDSFVVGYGLDYGRRWRHLPDLCVLEDLEG